MSFNSATIGLYNSCHSLNQCYIIVIWDPWEYISVKVQQFSFKKIYNQQCRLQNGRHFVSASVCWFSQTPSVNSCLWRHESENDDDDDGDDMMIFFSVMLTVTMTMPMVMLVSGYPAVNLARHHPVWLTDYFDLWDTAASLVDGDTHTCSRVDQLFWAVDLGFNAAVDGVTIVPSNFAGSTLFMIKI